MYRIPILFVVLQVHGVTKDTLDFVENVILTEINLVTDVS